MRRRQFEKVRVAMSRDETPEHTLLRLEGGPPSLYREHCSPGQVAQVRLAEIPRPSYLALASLPGESHFEILVRGGGRFADTLRRLVPGDTVEVSHPLGAGFPLQAARARDLWLVAAGSGIAALRGVARLVAAERGAFGRVCLLYGVRGHDHVPFAHEMSDWRSQGIEVVLTASRHGEEDGWSGRRGYVQDVLLDLAPDLAGAMLFACGMAPMIEALRAAAVRLGLEPSRLVTNA